MNGGGGSGREFRLELLEPRLLLSDTPLAIAGAAPPASAVTTEEVDVSTAGALDSAPADARSSDPGLAGSVPGGASVFEGCALAELGPDAGPEVQSPAVLGMGGGPPAPTAESEPNNVAGSATPLTLREDPEASGLWLAAGIGTVNPANDIDYWSVTLVAGDRLNVSVDSSSATLRANLRLFSPSLLVVANNSGGGPGNGSLIGDYTVPASGTYRIDVRGAVASATGDYDLRVRVGRGLQLESDASYGNDSVAGANPIVFSLQTGPPVARIAGSIMGFESANTDEDHFALGSLAAGEQVELNLALPTGSTLAGWVRLLDGEGNVVPDLDGDVLDGHFRGTISVEGPYYAEVAGLWIRDGQAYHLAKKQSWQAAETYATSLRGHLATVNDASEQEWLYATFAGAGSAWIGLNDEATEGTWVWASGQPVTYTNWGTGKPATANNDYAYLAATEGKWVDASRTATAMTLVEWTDAAGRVSANPGPGAEYLLTLRLSDRSPPRLIDEGDLPPDGGLVSVAPTGFVLGFNEELDPETVNGAAWELRSSGADRVFDTADDQLHPIAVSPDYAGGTAVRLELTGGPLSDGYYRFTAPATVADLAGNRLDGNQDGTGGDAFQRSFRVDSRILVPLPVPLQTLLPFGAGVFGLPSQPGSQSWKSGFVRGSLTGTETADYHTIFLKAGQTLSIQVQYGPLQLEVTDPTGALLATTTSGADQAALLQAVPIGSAGTYTVGVKRTAAPVETYSLSLLLNAVFEVEESEGTNDDLASAQVLGSVGNHAAVFGAAGLGSDDSFAIELAAGEMLSAVTGTTVPGRYVTLSVLDHAGVELARGTRVSATNVTEAASAFVAPTAGRYYMRVTGEAQVEYCLALLPGAQFDLELDGEGEAVQVLQGGTAVAGFLSAWPYDAEPDAFPAGTVLTDAFPGVTLTVQGTGTNVTSLTSDRRTTGNRVFGYGGGGGENLWQSSDRWLRIEFEQPVDAVALDFVPRAFYSRQWGVLQAYDAAGNQLAVVETEGASTQTLSVSRPRAEIKYVLASGLGVYQAALDNLVVGDDKADAYRLVTSPGTTIHLETQTLGFNLAEPTQTLNPRLEVRDASGALIAQDDNSAPDTFNAALSFNATAEFYTVTVTGRGQGRYTLQISGSELVNPLPSVTAVSPAENAVVAHAPAYLDVTFTEPVRSDQLDPGALVVEGRGAASAAWLIDGRTVRYTVGLDVADAEGRYRFSLAGGAAVDLQGQASPAFNGTFFVDRTGPFVVAHSPAPAIGVPFGQITLTFSEELDAASVQKADLVSFTGPAGNLLPQVSRIEVDGATVTVVFAPLQRAEGSYTLVLGPGFEDLVGNPMDQDHDGTYGEPTDTYTAVVDLAPPNLTVESVTIDPSPAHFGEQVEIEWIVRNAGRGEAVGAWNVWIWLSLDDEIQPGTDWVLFSGLSATPDPLPAGSTTPQVATVSLPILAGLVEGTYQVRVILDVDAALFESDDTDNAGTAAVALSYPRLPDLQVAARAVPTVSYPGGGIRVEWTVTNRGDGPAEQDWRDAVYFSADAVFDEATDTWLATFDAQDRSPLEPGAAYPVAQNVKVPVAAPAGRHYLLVVTDRYGDQVESDNTNNVAAVEIEVRAPDLVLQGIESPASAQFASSIGLAWTVRNPGTFDAMAGWQDAFWLSQDAVYSADDRPLAAVASTAPVPFGFDAPAHRQTAQVKLPIDPALAEGDYFILVRLDALLAIPELDETNNWGAAPIRLTLPPLPDLIVSEVIAPTQAYSGSAIPVTWTLSNQGSGAASGTWIDRVWVANDPSGTAALVLAEFEYTGRIEAGGTLTRRQAVDLPYDLAGMKWVLVSTDVEGDLYEHLAEANNTESTSSPSAITLGSFPNLEILSITRPDSAFNYQEIVIEWVVKNTGTGPTTVPVWTDEVWLSADRILTPGKDLLLGSVENASYLNAGESYVNRLEVRLPIDTLGQYHLVIWTDTHYLRENGQRIDVVVEPGHEEDNLRVSEPFQIELTPPPDLQVTALIAPPSLVYGQDLTVQYTVTNLGPGPIRGPNSSGDSIFISRDEAVDFPGGGDIMLGKNRLEIDLDPGESYSGTITFAIDWWKTRNTLRPVPRDLAGDYYVIVWANWDADHNVYEDGFAGNNGATSALHIYPEPDPDLEAVAVDMPATGLAGHDLPVAFRVVNAGPGSTDLGMGWTEAFFLSKDTVWDDGDILYHTLTMPHPALVPGAEVTSDGFPLQLPYDIEGEYYLILRTDYGDRLGEVDETNNTVVSSHTIRIESRPPDLVAVWNSTPLEASAGQTVLVTYTVTNQGTGDSIADRWVDQIFLNPNEREIARVPHYGLLAPGASYTASTLVALPVDLHGAYALVVRADAAPEGPGDVREGGNETNNDSPSAALNVTRHPSDLQVTRFVIPDRLVAGQTARFEWTVLNTGTGFTDAEAWLDQAFLSADAVLGPDDILLSRVVGTTGAVLPGVSHNEPLAPDAEYKVAALLKVPAGLVGTWHVLLSIDADDAVDELEETNNAAISTQPIQSSLPSTPDLAVESIIVPAQAWSGTYFDCSWTVHNLGSTASGGWSDYVYLSSDQVFDPNTDTYLGRVDRHQGLGADASYTEAQRYVLPKGIGGPHYVFVFTDRRDRLDERDAEANNLGISSASTDVGLLPRVELVVTGISVPPTAIIGQPISLTYEVRNGSDAAAVGPWSDALYLSADRSWDLADVSLAQLVRESIGPNAARTYTVSAEVPGLLPGKYYLLVRTDVRNQVREIDEQHNVLAADAPIDIGVPWLTLGTPASATLTTGQSAYYRVEVPEGETLWVTLDSEATEASTELYLRYGSIASRAEFDLRYTAAFAPDQELLIPVTRAGTYYLLAYGDRASPEGAAYTIEARLLGFEVLDTTYGQGGNAGNFTLSVTGAKFDRTVTVSLKDAHGLVRPAGTPFLVDSSRLYATFDLTGLAPGFYDVVFSKTGAAEVVVPDGLEVVAGGGADLRMSFATPPSVLANREYSFVVSWWNVGLNDALAPLARIAAQGCTFSPSPGVDHHKVGLTFLGTASDGGPAGILRPGQQEVLIMYVLAGSSGTTDWFDLTEVLTDPDAPFAWGDLRDSLANDIAPEDMGAIEFEQVFAQLRLQVGTTQGDFLRMLSRNATLLPAELGNPRFPDALLALEFRRAQATLGTSLAGAAFTPDPEVDLSGRAVGARNVLTGEWVVTTSLNDGSFLFEQIAPGTYELTFDGALILGNRTFAVSEGQALANAQLTLERGATIRGGIRDATTGLPLAGILVRATTAAGAAILDATSDLAGQYQLTPLPEAEYTLIATGPNQALYRSVPMGVDQETVIYSIEMLPAGTLTGLIEFEPGGPVSSPLAVAAVLGSGADTGRRFGAEIEGNRFTLTGLPAGTYTLVASREGYLLKEIAGVTLETGAARDLGTIQLARAAAVNGRVTNHVAGLNPADLLVVALQGGAPVGAALVDAGGHFRLTNLAAGSYTFKVLATGEFVSTEASATLAGGEAPNLIQLQVWPGGAVSGLVSDTASGLPATGVSVTAYGPAGTPKIAVTDATGHYRIGGLALGQHLVTLASGTQGGSRTVAIVDLDGSPATVDLSFTSVATLGGTLRDAALEPLAGGWVGLYEAGALVTESTTTADGRYVFYLLRPGTFELRATASRQSFTPVPSISITAGMAATRDLIAGTGSIEVTFPGLAEPPVGATVTLWLRLGLDRLAADQRAVEAATPVVFTGLAPGDYVVEVEASDNRGAAGTATLAAGAGATLPLTLTPRGRLTGQITDNAGHPLPHAIVTLYSQLDPSVTFLVQADAEGRFEIAYLPPAPYDMVFLADDHSALVMADVHVAGEQTLKVVLAPSTSELTGRLLDGQGLPVRGGSVVVQDAAGRVIGRAAVGADGSFRVTTAWGDQLSLSAQARGFARVVVDLGTLAAGSSRDLGSVSITPVALGTAPGLNPGAAAVWDEVLPTLRRAVALLGGGGGGEGPSYMYTIWDVLTTFGKEEGHVEPMDIPTLPAHCVETCGDAWQWANAMQKYQDGKWDLVDEQKDVLLKFIGIALGQWIAESLQNAAVVGSVILLGAQIGASVGLIAVSTVAGLSTLAAMITGIVSSVVGLFMTGLQMYWDSLVPEDPKEAAKVLETAESITGNTSSVAGLIQTAIDAIRKFKGWSDIEWYHAGELLGVIGLLASWRSIVQHFTYQDLISTCYSMDSQYNDWKFSRDKYTQAVAEAKERLEQYKDCLDACEKKEPWEGEKYPSDSKYSLDPNDILGPIGVGAEQWVNASDRLNYTIRFENDALLATAPARVVRVTQPLDPDLDWRTFRLGTFGFGSYEITPPANATSYSGRLDLTQTLNVILFVTAGIDLDAGQAYWEFVSIDPATGVAPDNPFSGFLPPNTNPPEGQGWITYSIRPKATATTGSVIEAMATIVFDDNEPIDTPVWFNTLDAAPPSSSVAALPATTPSPQFLVSWSGTDDVDGSGLAGYSVFVSDTGLPFEPWLDQVTFREAPFVGLPGHTYTFYAVAHDRAGNTEPAPASADAVTRVEGATATLAGQVWHDLNGNGLREFGETGLSNVTVTLFSAANQMIATAQSQADGGYRFENLAPNATYTIGFVTPGGYRFSPANQGASDLNDSDPDPTTGQTDAIIAVAGQNVGWDAAFHRLASIEGVVWRDTNGNGTRDAAETARPDSTVFIDANRNGKRDSGEIMTETGAAGTYRFSDLSPGRYAVLPIVPSSWRQTHPGPDGISESAIVDGVPRPGPTVPYGYSVVLVSGEHQTEVDFGLQPVSTPPPAPIARGINPMPATSQPPPPAPIARGVQPLSEPQTVGQSAGVTQLQPPSSVQLGWYRIPEFEPWNRWPQALSDDWLEGPTESAGSTLRPSRTATPGTSVSAFGFDEDSTDSSSRGWRAVSRPTASG